MSEIVTENTRPSMWQRSTIRRLLVWQFSRRTLRRELIALVWLISLIALYFGYADWTARRDWKSFKSNYEAHVGSLDYRTYIPKPIPDDDNFAATPFARSLTNNDQNSGLFANDAWSKASPMLGKPRQPANRRMTDLVAWQEAFAAVRDHAPKPQDGFRSDRLDLASRTAAAPDVLAGMRDDDDALAELQAASSRPDCRYDVAYNQENPWATTLPHLMRVKGACGRLTTRVCAELAEGKTEDALRDVKLGLYVGDSVKDEPFLISYLVRIACLQIACQPVWEGLAEHRWTAPQLAQLQDRLGQYNFLADLQHPLHAECALGAYLIDALQKKGLGFLADVSSGTGPADQKTFFNLVGPLIPSGWYEEEMIHYCAKYDGEFSGAMDTGTKQVFPDRIAANAEEVNSLQRNIWGAIWRHEMIARIMLPALQRLPLRAAVAQTTLDQAAVACALERYRLAKGQFPDDLQSLAPDFIKDLPNDVISGKPLQYRRAEDGQFVLYSIGWDQKDNGGIPGKTQFNETNGDWVWQYPNSR